MLMAFSVAAGLLGSDWPTCFMSLEPGDGRLQAHTFSGPYRWLYNKYFVDEAYDATGR